MNLKYIKNDLKHYFVNSPLTMWVFLFYSKYGFYGWPHLLSVIFIHFSIFSLDDWLDMKRPFPYYLLPMLAFSALYYPLITALALCGNLIANLRALTKRNYFVLERLEALGNIPIFVLPFTLPVGLNNFKLYLAAALYLLFADSFHKIGHRETTQPRLMWTSGIVCLIAVVAIFAKPNILFVFFAITTFLSLVPFKIIKNLRFSWTYTQIWFGFIGFVGFYYYLYFVV